MRCPFCTSALPALPGDAVLCQCGQRIMLPAGDPWDRDDSLDLTEERWIAFLGYLRLPRPRARYWQRLAYRLGRAVGTLRQWAVAGRWEARAAAWDAGPDLAGAEALHASLVAANQEAARTVTEEHAPIYARARRILELGITELMDQAEEGGQPLTIRELLQLFPVLQAEHDLRKGETPPVPDLSQVPTEDLRRLSGGE